MTVINNPSRRTAYYDRRSARFTTPEEFLSADALKAASLDAHIENAEKCSYNLCSYKPVIKDIYPIPPRTMWHFEGEEVALAKQRRVPLAHCPSLAEIEKRTARLLSFISSDEIALELSGGLDSAIALAVLHKNGVRPLLIGSTWSAYEFRTERAVQQALAQSFSLDTILDEDAPYPFESLAQVPPHPLPDELSISYARVRKNIDISEANGKKIIIGGFGGDALLCNPIIADQESFLFEPWTWDVHWANENLYDHSSCRYYSAYSFRSLVPALVALRASKGKLDQDDTYKIAARNIFQESLPRELTEYVYKGSANGIFLRGIQRARDEIHHILAMAGQEYPDERLSRQYFEENIGRYSEMTEAENRKFISLITFACWIFAFFRR
jgi:hypothetical protein